MGRDDWYPPDKRPDVRDTFGMPRPKAGTGGGGATPSDFEKHLGREAALRRELEAGRQRRARHKDKPTKSQDGSPDTKSTELMTRFPGWCDVCREIVPTGTRVWATKRETGPWQITHLNCRRY